MIYEAIGRKSRSFAKEGSRTYWTIQLRVFMEHKKHYIRIQVRRANGPFVEMTHRISTSLYNYLSSIVCPYQSLAEKSTASYSPAQMRLTQNGKVYIQVAGKPLGRSYGVGFTLRSSVLKDWLLA